jgi:hypothetical protein
MVLTATMRGAKQDPATLTTYSNRLAKEPIEDVLSALEKLAEMPRQEFEPALPDIGTVLQLVKTCNVARLNRLESVRSQRLVVWECPDCGHTMNGFPAANADLDRRCNAPWRKVNGKRDSLRRGQICGGRMRVFLDEAVQADSGPLEKWEMPGIYSQRCLVLG